MDRETWMQVWGHFVSALGLAMDERRVAQGHAWWKEFVRNEPDEATRLAMRTLLDRTETSFPEYPEAREAFRSARKVYEITHRELVEHVRCSRCDSSGRRTLFAVPSSPPRWVGIDDLLAMTGKITGGPSSVVACECGLGARFQAGHGMDPGSADAALRRWREQRGEAAYEQAFGRLLQARAA